MSDEIRTIMNAVEIGRMRTGVNSIVGERIRQCQKWGIQHHADRDWNPILGEEFGEVQRALCEDIWGGGGNLREELIHTAAVALAWIEDIDRRSAELDVLMGLKEPVFEKATDEDPGIEEAEAELAYGGLEI